MSSDPSLLLLAVCGNNIDPTWCRWCSYQPGLSYENKTKRNRRGKGTAVAVRERRASCARSGTNEPGCERGSASAREGPEGGAPAAGAARRRRGPAALPAPLGEGEGRGLREERPQKGPRGRTMEQVEWERARGRRNTGAGSPGGAAPRGRRALRSGPGRLRVCPELRAGGRAGPGRAAAPCV